jgi:hypothetical protein
LQTSRISIALAVTGLIFLKSLFFGGQDVVQFLDELQKFLPILFHRDLGAQVLNTIVVSLVHKRSGSITVFTVGRMFDVERCLELPGAFWKNEDLGPDHS